MKDETYEAGYLHRIDKSIKDGAYVVTFGGFVSHAGTQGEQ